MIPMNLSSRIMILKPTTSDVRVTTAIVIFMGLKQNLHRLDTDRVHKVYCIDLGHIEQTHIEGVPTRSNTKRGVPIIQSN